ncbi:hypothetical protein WOLCODRAFT_165468 [Wolfiporia cocos MD-104 SS10]|uniref:Uncharacterized protein n=1 Tax=Wolfiporia cocos (strain MD-104) TaxID=742152 RepID=A0A2H3JRU9_WOLCO|nr:hypothetical protein WOLCODRAFT_165468 [Wolfiporia cocos MD-104 SS10]
MTATGSSGSSGGLFGVTRAASARSAACSSLELRVRVWQAYACFGWVARGGARLPGGCGVVCIGLQGKDHIDAIAAVYGAVVGVDLFSTNAVTATVAAVQSDALKDAEAAPDLAEQRRHVSKQRLDSLGVRNEPAEKHSGSGTRARCRWRSMDGAMQTPVWTVALSTNVSLVYTYAVRALVGECSLHKSMHPERFTSPQTFYSVLSCGVPSITDAFLRNKTGARRLQLRLRRVRETPRDDAYKTTHGGGGAVPVHAAPLHAAFVCHVVSRVAAAFPPSLFAPPLTPCVPHHNEGRVVDVSRVGAAAGKWQ